MSIDDVPPSFNETRYAHWRVASREKKKWQGIFELLLLQQKVPRGVGYVEAEARLRFPVRRRRDEGNFRTPIEKALGDALVNGRWILDDTEDFFRMGAVSLVDVGPLRTEVTLAWR